jgi:hypothetical protein
MPLDGKTAASLAINAILIISIVMNRSNLRFLSHFDSRSATKNTPSKPS